MYNKIFTKILMSSIWLETDATRIVWISLIAAMDETGFVQAAAVGNLANMARVSVADAQTAVEKLSGPDPESSDPDNEGKRIERVPGGWMVLNAEKYRDIVTRAVAQERNRQRVAIHRSKKEGKVTVGNGQVTDSNKVKRSSNGPVTQSYSYSESESVKRKVPKENPCNGDVIVGNGDVMPVVPIECTSTVPLEPRQPAPIVKAEATVTPLIPKGADLPVNNGVTRLTTEECNERCNAHHEKRRAEHPGESWDMPF